MTTETGGRLLSLLGGGVVAVATVFVGTLVARLFPASVPSLLQPGVIALAGVALWFVRGVPRVVSAGVVAGGLLHAGILYWLFVSWS